MRGLRSQIIKLSIFGFVAILITVSVVASLLDLKLGQPVGGYHAMFSNATVLQAGDTVRIAGIEVGKVNAVHLKGYQAEVDFSVSKSQPMTTTTRASIAFQNLLGQRYLSIDPGPPGGAPMKAGATIPEAQTTPGLDLTAVFTGFQPLLAALNPTQVNQLTGSIIAVFQGESGAVANLVSQTASLTSNLAQRSTVINQVLDNLTPLLTQVNTSDGQIGKLIDSFDSVVKGLTTTNLGPAITGASQLTQNVSTLISGSQPYIDQDLSKLVGATQTLSNNEVPIDNVLKNLDPTLAALNRVANQGSYLSVYICDLTVHVSGPISVNLLNGGAATQSPPLTLNAGVIGNQVEHFGVCR